VTDTTKTRIRWLVTGLILAACVVGYAWASYAARVRDRELRVQVEHQREVLDLIGAVEAERNRRPETVTPALADDAAKARATGAGAVAAVRIITREVPFAVPGDCPASPPLAGPGAGQPSPSAVPPPVMVAIDQQGLIFAQGDGRIRWKGVTFASLRRGEWSERRELPEDAVHTDFAVDPALEKAWARYVQGQPWQADIRLGAVIAPDPGLRLGGTWYGRRRRMGWWADLEATQRSTSSYDSYTEATVYGQAVSIGGAVGIGWRIGPR
jgi:hypothetical protein